jgi:hypothetical protein
MTRRWTNMPDASDVAYTPPDDCCFDALTIQDAIDQLIMKDKMVAIQMDGDAVIGVCDLVEWETDGIYYMKKVIQ